MTTQIVLVSGFWLGAWAWDEVAPRLRDEGFDVVALTLPGVSEASPDATATVDAQADAIVGALDPQADRRVLWCTAGRQCRGPSCSTGTLGSWTMSSTSTPPPSRTATR